MQQRILQKHHQGSCLEYEIDNLYDSHLEGRHIFLSLHALMLLSVLLDWITIVFPLLLSSLEMMFTPFVKFPSINASAAFPTATFRIFIVEHHP